MKSQDPLYTLIAYSPSDSIVPSSMTKGKTCGDVPSMPRKTSHRGQVSILLLAMLVVLVTAVFWLFDLHSLILGKLRVQDASDTSTLSAARWQGLTLNLIGELNLLHALTLTQGDHPGTIHSITNLQGRLCFTGPVYAFAAAQHTAMKNDIDSDEDVVTLIELYLNNLEMTREPGGELDLSAPYPGAWEDFIEMMREALIVYGVRAAPLNEAIYGLPSSYHILYNRSFYNAITTSDWCWFYFNMYGELKKHVNYTSWAALPDETKEDPSNPGIFPLNIQHVTRTLNDLSVGRTEALPEGTLVKPRETLNPQLAALDHPLIPDEEAQVDNPAYDPENLIADPNDPEFEPTTISSFDLPQTWYIYNPAYWREWIEFNADLGFPVSSPLKSQYDYYGADAVCATRKYYIRPSEPDSDAELVDYSGAAKAFGSINVSNPSGVSEELPPHTYELILPAFDDVRLIPYGSSSCRFFAQFDMGWMAHVSSHVPLYSKTGSLPRKDKCRYCRGIETFDAATYRAVIIKWLSFNSGTCVRAPVGDGGGGGGGNNQGSGGTTVAH